jgi:hypothetical protein
MDTTFQAIHLEYDLARRQRWDVHVAAWLPALPQYLFVVALMVPLIWWASQRSPWFLLFSIAPLWVLRGLIAGIVQVSFMPAQHMNIIINEQGLGFMTGNQRWWVHLDSIVRIDRYRDDLWTFACYHGEMISVPVSLISEEALAHVRARMEWSRTPEGVQAAVNRGRQLVGLEVKRPEGANSSTAAKQGKSDD